MKGLEIVAGLILALVAFVVLKIIGLVLKFALIAAVLGFVAGILIARMFRRPAS
jgi:multisubunit Na+/H+ antiporter MnhF subunit